MSDFEDRLGRALSDGAEEAPGARGVAEGARVLARRRRNRRVVAGTAAAVIAIAVPMAVVTSGSGPGSSKRTDAIPPAASPELPRVTCGGGPGWEVETMDGGLPGVLDDAEVRAAFADVLREAPMDAPTAIRVDGAEQAAYIVLADDGDGYTVGLGDWSIAGPARDAMSAGLERQPGGGLRMTSWGDCGQLEVVVPQGRARVEVTGPSGGVDRTTDAPVVLATESDCTSGRDPSAYLGEPAVTEDDSRVVVNLTSEAIVGGADCPGNPSVPLTLSLDEPIGDRELYDGGTFPPTPIKLVGRSPSSDDWQTVTYEGAPVNESGDNTVVLDLPPGWARLDSSGCEYDVPRFGLPGNDPCDEVGNVSFFGSATYDSCCFPGLDGPDDTSGDAYVGSLVGYVDAPDHETARRILAALRLPGQRAPSETWRTETIQEVQVDVPDDDTVVIEAERTNPREKTQRSLATTTTTGEWTAIVHTASGVRVHATAPTQALADLVASSVRIAD